MHFVLDSNAVIHVFNKSLRLSAEHSYFISIITEIELLSFSKLTQEDIVETRKALSKFKRIHLTDPVKERTIQIRRMNKIKLPDCIIIASALEEKATLITYDQQLINCQLVLNCIKKDRMFMTITHLNQLVTLNNKLP